MTEVRVSYQFTPEQVDMVLEGLNSLAHGRVRKLYDAIHDHAIKTVDEARAASMPKPRRRKKTSPEDASQAPAA